MYRIRELYNLDFTLAGDYLREFEYPWQAIGGIRGMLEKLIPTLSVDFRQISPDVWVHARAEIAPTACIVGPCVIGAGTQVRHGAYIRGGVLAGENCVVGNSTELKNVILFDGVQVPHYNYVGDSILGFRAHMGAGSVCSNVRADKRPVRICEQKTGLRKCGAMLGDYAEIGCNAVLNPGTIVGRRSRVYPLSCVRGVVPEDCIYKNNGEIVGMGAKE